MDMIPFTQDVCIKKSGALGIFLILILSINIFTNSCSRGMDNLRLLNYSVRSKGCIKILTIFYIKPLHQLTLNSSVP